MRPDRLARAVAAFVLASALPLAQAAYIEKAVANGGSVRGKVTFQGALPPDAVEKITISKNPEVCDVDKTGAREVVWVDVKDSALRGAFVFIDKIKAGKKWPAPKGGKFVVNQEGCRFRPWAQVVKPGPLTIKHSDPATVLHNINAREMIGVEKGRVVRSTIFNFAQPDPGEIVKQLTIRRSHYVSLNCEAHNFMFGFMMTPEHPYAVVVNEDGSYTLDDVPPGDYTVLAWHPKFGLKEAKVNVPAGGKAQASFAFSAK
ncbi:MAG: carboxypeptidase regulatory-like domain-containing protein [Betaproteobacteria bacterium]|nr:carboxypeptidase regulatory-like domain-containing protein [Betaproteobacteria bacterium]